MTTSMTPVTVGDKIPNTSVSLRDGDINLVDHFNSRRGIFVGVSGAFEPISTRLLTALRPHLPLLKSIVSMVAVVSVNDPYVLKAWGNRLKLVDELTFISDVNGSYSERLGMVQNMNHCGLGKVNRAKMFVMVVEHNAKITYLDDTSDLETMVNKLKDYIVKLSTRPINIQEIPKSSPFWQKSSKRCQERSICYLAKNQHMDEGEIMKGPKVTSSHFSCDNEVMIENNGRYLEITGLRGTISHDGDDYLLQSVIYRTELQHKTNERCDVEMQLVFNASTGAAKNRHVMLSIPLAMDGSDMLLSSLPGPKGGYPIAPNHTMKCTITDEIILDRGIEYHLFGDMPLVTYMKDRELWFIGTECHGISTKQVLELKAMLINAGKPEKTKTKNVWKSKLSFKQR